MQAATISKKELQGSGGLAEEAVIYFYRAVVIIIIELLGFLSRWHSVPTLS